MCDEGIGRYNCGSNEKGGERVQRISMVNQSAVRLGAGMALRVCLMVR